MFAGTHPNADADAGSRHAAVVDTCPKAMAYMRPEAERNTRLEAVRHTRPEAVRYTRPEAVSDTWPETDRILTSMA